MTGAAVVGDSGLGEDLGGLVRRGLVWSTVNTLVGKAGQLLTTIVLARLLAPAEMGVFAVAMVAFQIVMSCNELGVSVAIVRWPDEPDRIIPTVWTLNLLSSAALAALCWAGAPWFAEVQGAPEAAGVLRILVLAVPVAGLTAVPYALVQRGFRQDLRTVAELVNLVTSTTVVLTLAAAGHGPSSLAWSQLAGNGVAGAFLLLRAPRPQGRYRPGLDRSLVRPLLRFGMPLAGASLLVFAVLNVDYLIVGRSRGPAELALYVLAFNIAFWPVQSVSAVLRAVSMPAFARVQRDPARCRAALQRSMGALLALALPAAALLASLAGPLVRVLYGRRWGAAADALAFLAVLGACRVVVELSYDYLVGIGRSRVVFGLQALWLVVLTPTLVLGVAVDGYRGAAVTHAIVAVGVVLPAFGLALKRTGVDVVALARLALVPGLAAGAVLGTAMLSQLLVDGDLASLAVGGVLSATVGAGVLLWRRRALWPVGDPVPALEMP